MDDIDFHSLGLHTGSSASLLKYYQDKIRRFDEERKSQLQRIADVEIGAQDIHKLRWELKNRSEEVEVLQKALQDAKLYLYDEREQVIKLTHENENLKQQEVEDRRRIQELLALTQPASEEPVDPTSAASYGRNGFPILPSSKPSPAVSADAQLVDSLRKQVDEVRRLCDDRTTAYARDRAALLEQAAQRKEADAATIKQLEGKVETLQDKLTSLTRDFLLQRHQHSLIEREAREAAAVAGAQRDEAVAQLVSVSDRAEAEIRTLRDNLEAQAKELRRVLSSKLESAADAVKLVSARAESDRKAAESTIKRLNEQVRRLRESSDKVIRRRKLEIEGYQRDISALKRAVRMIEGQWASAADLLASAGESVSPDLFSLPPELTSTLHATEEALAKAAGMPLQELYGLEEALDYGYVPVNRRAGTASAPMGGSPPPSSTSTVGKGKGSTRTQAAQGASSRRSSATQEPAPVAGSSRSSGRVDSTRKGAVATRQAGGTGAGVGAGYGRPTLAGYNPVTYAQDVLRESLTTTFPSHGPDGRPIAPFPGDLDYPLGTARHTGAAQGSASSVGGVRSPSGNGRGTGQQTTPPGSTGSSGSSGKLSGGARRVPVSSPEAAPRFDVAAQGGALWEQALPDEEEGDESADAAAGGMQLTPDQSQAGGEAEGAQGQGHSHGGMFSPLVNPLSRSRHAEIQAQLASIQQTLQQLESQGSVPTAH